MKGPQTLRNLGCALDRVYWISSRYMHETMSFNYFLKQGWWTDFQSLRMTLFAITIPNWRACCNVEGRVKEKFEQPSISQRQSGSSCCLYISLYTWKMSTQKLLSLGQYQKRWPRIPSSELHLSQMGETEGKMLFNLVLEKCNRWVTLNWMSWSLALME